MPRVKIDYVVSFSSEDPGHPASNLLATEVSKKSWLCSKGEPSCSVVLQLERAVEIDSVQIGVHHAALVEVLAGLSERPSDPFEVVVPSCVFVPAGASRRELGVARVRSFARAELAAGARGRRYDRVRVVCSQPYNKHCQYGLSFIHINEPEGRAAPAAPAAAPASVPARQFSLETHSSDDEEFRPGELFAQRAQPPPAPSTGAQIRQATASALKNMPDASTKLTRTPIAKAARTAPAAAHTAAAAAPAAAAAAAAPTAARHRDGLVYTAEDGGPHARIDRVISRHRDERHKEDQRKGNADDSTADKHTDSTKKVKNGSKPRDDRRETTKLNAEDRKEDKLNVSTDARTVKNAGGDSGAGRGAGPAGGPGEAPRAVHSRKRKRGDDDDKPDLRSELAVGPVCRDPRDILRGVTFALSGYADDKRASLRAAAVRLGARYSPDWTPACTHLICAFPNTPRLRAVRAAGGAGAAGVATAAWVEACAARGRRLPWQWFATLPRERVPAAPLEDDEPPARPAPASPASSEDECADAAMAEEFGREFTSHDDPPSPARRPSAPSSPSSPSAPSAPSTPGDGDDDDGDVQFVRDERYAAELVVVQSDSDLTDEDEAPGEEALDPDKLLPAVFSGRTFVFGRGARAALRRGVRALGGLVLEEDEVQEDSEVHFVLGAGGSGGSGGCGGAGARVDEAWLWRCRRARRLLPPPSG